MTTSNFKNGTKNNAQTHTQHLNPVEHRNHMRLFWPLSSTEKNPNTSGCTTYLSVWRRMVRLCYIPFYIVFRKKTKSSHLSPQGTRTRRHEPPRSSVPTETDLGYTSLVAPLAAGGAVTLACPNPTIGWSER